MADPALEALERAIRRRFGEGARLDNIALPTLGGSNKTIVFDLVEGNARRRLVSRQETIDFEGNPFLPPSKQFRVMQVVHRHGFPVPEPVFEFEPADAMGRGFVTAFVTGETMPKKLLTGREFDAVRPDLAGQLGAALAQLHAIDPKEADFLEDWPDSVDAIMAQRDRVDTYVEAHPALELGFRWLERNRPDAPRRSIVHGDFRVGNFMVGPDGLHVVLDWECCHLGNGIEDIGWLCTRSWRFGRVDRPVGGLDQYAPLFAAYQAAGGRKVDEDEVHYWEVFGLVRWAVINMMQGYGHMFAGRRSPVFAACGRNVSQFEYELLMTLSGRYR